MTIKFELEHINQMILLYNSINKLLPNKKVPQILKQIYIVKSNRYIHGFKTKSLVLNPCIYLLNNICKLQIVCLDEIKYIYIAWYSYYSGEINKYIHGFKNKKLFVQWSMKDKKIHFVKCKR